MIFRIPAQATSWNLVDVITSFLGTFAVCFFIGVNKGFPSPVGVAFAVAGSILSIISLISLNRSFGVLPAEREIKTGGLYRLVRHPLYLSYQIFNIGYLLNHPTLYNGTVAVLCLLSQLLRIYSEERFLMRNPAYLTYQKRVRWRMLPFIF